jgi:hypothetical protein
LKILTWIKQDEQSESKNFEFSRPSTFDISHYNKKLREAKLEYYKTTGRDELWMKTLRSKAIAVQKDKKKAREDRKAEIENEMKKECGEGFLIQFKTDKRCVHFNCEPSGQKTYVHFKKWNGNQWQVKDPKNDTKKYPYGQIKRRTAVDSLKQDGLIDDDDFQTFWNKLDTFAQTCSKGRRSLTPISEPNRVGFPNTSESRKTILGSTEFEPNERSLNLITDEPVHISNDE